jgi:NAD(P)-dependent dehydrogenase (short-subunit alcohol dehydrogenase family)
VSDATTPFSGQAALVTGAGGGIGRAIAEALAAGGAAVGVVGRRRESLAEVDLRGADEDDRVFVADLTADDEVRSVVDEFVRRLGRLDVLVHSNGVHLAAPLEDTEPGDFDRLWASNVRGPFVLTQLLLPQLRAARGQIVFVNSSTGLEARQGVGLFSATQHALRALADTLRGEVNPDGIRVLSVYPGRTATARQERIFRQEGRPYDPTRLLQPEDVAATVCQALSAPRSAEITDIRIRPLLKST